jgi:hypothetical protein
MVVHVEEADLGFPVFPAIFDAVVDQVRHRLSDFLMVGINIDCFLIAFAEFEARIFFFRPGLEDFKNLFGKGHDVEIRVFRFELTGFQEGDFLEVIHDIDHSVNALFGPVKVFFVDGGVVDAPVEQGKHVTLYVKNGCFQLMRDIADEFPSVLGKHFQLFNLFRLPVAPLFHVLFHFGQGIRDFHVFSE